MTTVSKRDTITKFNSSSDTCLAVSKQNPENLEGYLKMYPAHHQMKML